LVNDVDVVFKNKAAEELTFLMVFFRKTLTPQKKFLDIIKEHQRVKYEINGKTIIMK